MEMNTFSNLQFFIFINILIIANGLAQSIDPSSSLLPNQDDILTAQASSPTSYKVKEVELENIGTNPNLLGYHQNGQHPTESHGNQGHGQGNYPSNGNKPSYPQGGGNYPGGYPSNGGNQGNYPGGYPSHGNGHYPPNAGSQGGYHPPHGGGSYYPPNGGNQGGTGYHPPNGGNQGGTGYHPPNGGNQGGTGYHPPNGGNQGGTGYHPPNGGNHGGGGYYPPNGGNHGGGGYYPPNGGNHGDGYYPPHGGNTGSEWHRCEQDHPICSRLPYDQCVKREWLWKKCPGLCRTCKCIDTDAKCESYKQRCSYDSSTRFACRRTCQLCISKWGNVY